MLFHVNVKVIHNVDMVIDSDSMKTAILDAMDVLDEGVDSEYAKNVIDQDETVLDYGDFSCEFVSDAGDCICPDCREQLDSD